MRRLSLQTDFAKRLMQRLRARRYRVRRSVKLPTFARLRRRLMQRLKSKFTLFGRKSSIF